MQLVELLKQVIGVAVVVVVEGAVFVGTGFVVEPTSLIDLRMKKSIREDSDLLKEKN